MSNKFFDYFFWCLLIVAFIAGPLRYKIHFFAGGSLLLCWFYMVTQVKNIKDRIILCPLAFVCGWLALCLIKSDFHGMGVLWQSAVVPITALGYLVFLLQRGDYVLYRNCLYLSLLIVLPFVIVTLSADMGASRTLAGNAITFAQLVEAYENRIKGVLDYGAIHSFPFLIMGVYVSCRLQKNIKHKLLLGAFALLLFAVMVKSVFFAAFVVTCGLLYLSNGDNFKMRFIVFIGAILSIWALWATGTIVHLLEFFVNIVFGVDSDSIAVVKVKQIADYYYLGTGFEGRENRYEVAINGFLNNILIGGIDEHEDAGHSFVLQILGDFGLIGFTIYLCYFRSLFKVVSRVLPQKLRWYYSIMIIGFIVLALVKNIGLSIEVFMIFGWAPMFLLLREEDFYIGVANARRHL